MPIFAAAANLYRLRLFLPGLGRSKKFGLVLIAAVILARNPKGMNRRSQPSDQLMFRFKTLFMVLALGLITPIGAYAATFCIAVNGGFGHGGYTFIAPNLTLPTANQCAAWSGYTKTASTVILISNGTVCRSNSGKVLDLSIFSTDPDFFGIGAQQYAWDSIEMCPTGVTGCPFTSQDTSSNNALGGGIAEEVTCTAGLLLLPQTHD